MSIVAPVLGAIKAIGAIAASVGSAVGSAAAAAAPAAGALALKAVPALITAGATMAVSRASERQAQAQAQVQQSYYNSLQAQAEATKAEEDRITNESNQRARAYAAGLLNSDTNLYSVLNPSGYNSESSGEYQLLGNSLRSGSVSSMFA